MPFADNQGVRIHYDSVGSGPAVVLAHGLTASRQGWFDFGYVEALRRDYRVLVMELRGHGQSDKPHTADAYTREHVVGDVLAVLDDVGVDRAVYWGYSLGAATGYAAALLAAERFDAFVLGGMHPYPRSPQSGSGSRRPDRTPAFRQGMQHYYETIVKPELPEPLPEARLARLLANDGPALAAFMEGAVTWIGQDAAIARLTMPVLVYAGDADPLHEGAQRVAGELPDARFISLSGLNHSQASERADLVLPHVLPFLAKVAQQAVSPSPSQGEG